MSESSRERDRKRAAVLMAMIVNEHTMQDAAAIAAAASRILGDPEAIRPGSATIILRGMSEAGLVVVGEMIGPHGPDGRPRYELTDGGRYAAEAMRGVMGWAAAGEDGTRVVIPEEAIDRYVATRIPPLAGGGGEQ